MASIHEQIAEALVELLNAGQGYTGPIVISGEAELRWMPYVDKHELEQVRVDVVPRAERRELFARCLATTLSEVDIGIRQRCDPRDNERITALDTLVDDIKNMTVLRPMAGRAWQMQQNEPLFPRAMLEETRVYQAIVTNSYQYEA